MADDGWDYDEDSGNKGDTVRLAAALSRGRAPSFAPPPPQESSGKSEEERNNDGRGSKSNSSGNFNKDEDEDDEDEDDEEEWLELRDELVRFFCAAAPSDDAQGLFAQQKEAFERSAALVDCTAGLAEVLAQTVRNLLELSLHLMGRLSATESELLAAATRLEVNTVENKVFIYVYIYLLLLFRREDSGMLSSRPRVRSVF